jgi:toxin FitB
MYLVDTNVISHGRRGSPEALGWIESVKHKDIYFSVATILEISKGAAMLERRDPATAAVFSAWLAGLRKNHQKKFLPLTEDIALEAGKIAAIRSRNMLDTQIAATAIIHNMILVTRNVADFEDLPLTILNPWALA